MFGLPPITPSQVAQWGATQAITDNINRAIQESENGNDLGAAQAYVQAAAVTFAYGIGATYGLTTKLPLDGLSTAFQQLSSNPGLIQNLLQRTGLLTAYGEARLATSFAAVGNSFAGGAAMAYGINEFINVMKGLGFGSAIYDWLHPEVAPEENILYRLARGFTLKDPLALDLDGDGIETVGVNANILFDHDGDGIKTGTGWLKGDDGFLVLDRNGNGSIDSGAELFGADTVLANGAVGVDGFTALSDLDTNGDRVFDAADARFADVRVWRDLNQDGISQSNELFATASLGITAIDLVGHTATKTLAGGNVQTLAATASGQILATQNQIAYTGLFDKTNGTTGTAVALNLADNPFFRQYPDGSLVTDANPFTSANAPIPLSPEAQNLPDMQGAGAVRDLQEAASLSPALAQSVQGLIDTGIQSRQQLWSRMDSLVEQWAGTSGFVSSLEQAQTYDYTLHYVAPGASAADIARIYDIRSVGGGGGGGSVGDVITPEEQARLDTLEAEGLRLEHLIGLLERYNGMSFVNVGELGVTRGGGGFIGKREIAAATPGDGGGGVGPAPVYDVFVGLEAYQVQFLDKSYTELKQSLYDGLVLETRLKPYLDEVTLTIDESGIRLDASAMEARLAAYAGDPSDTRQIVLDGAADDNLAGGEVDYFSGQWAKLLRGQNSFLTRNHESIRTM